MNKRLVGEFIYDINEVPERYYSDDNKTFFTDNDQAMENEDLENWAVWINSPWDSKSEKYTITFDYKADDWQCKYTIVGYDSVIASVIGYGSTEEYALNNCKNLFRYLQEKYNLDNESY